MTAPADVVVIGGGVIGLAAACFLAQGGAQTHVVEKSWIGSGSTSAAAGVVALQTKSIGPKLTLAKRGLQLLLDLQRETDLDVELENQGSLVVARNGDELQALRDRAARLSNEGVQVQLLSAQDVSQHLPGLTERVIGGSFCPDDCTVNPLLLASAYRRKAEALGARISPHTEVVGVEAREGRIHAVLTRTQRIPTETVVNAAGISSPAIAGMVGLALPILPRKGEIIITEASPRRLVKGALLSAEYLASKGVPKTSAAEWAQGRAPRTGMQVGLLINQTRRGNLMIGSTREFAGTDTRSNQRALRELIHLAVEMMPAVRYLLVIRSYAGLRPASPDGLPIVSRAIELPGFVFATGHEGDGVALSAVTGEMVATLVLGRADEAEYGPFSLSRFAAELGG